MKFQMLLAVKEKKKMRCGSCSGTLQFFPCWDEDAKSWSTCMKSVLFIDPIPVFGCGVWCSFYQYHLSLFYIVYTYIGSDICGFHLALGVCQGCTDDWLTSNG